MDLQAPIAPPPVMTSDQILQHVDSVYQGLPDPVRQALDHAHTITGGGGFTGGTSLGDVAKPTPTPTPIAPPPVDPNAPAVSSMPEPPDMAPAPLKTANMPGVPVLPSVAPVPTSENGEIADQDRPQGIAPHPIAPSRTPGEIELSRLRTDGPGVNLIPNPFLRGVAKTADVLGSTFVKGLASNIPGTTAHNLQLQARAENEAKGKQASEKNAADVAETQAKTKEQESLPELHKTQAELAAEKIHSANEAKDKDRAIKQADEDRKKGESDAKVESHLRDAGWKRDDNGEIVPLPLEEMNDKQKNAHDTQAAIQTLRQSQSELADARTAYVQAQKDNIPKAQELALARIRTAQQNASTAAQRLGLSKDTFEAEFFGTNHGTALPGAPADEAGNPVGTRVAAITKPTGATQNRASQAGSIIEAGDNLKSEIDKHKDKLGNLSSYWNQAVNGTPIADPEVSKLMAEIGSYVALQPGMHGFRGAQALKEFEKIVGGVPKNPEALKAAIDGIAGTARTIQKSGTLHTVAPKGTGVAPIPLKDGTSLTPHDQAAADKFRKEHPELIK